MTVYGSQIAEHYQQQVRAFSGLSAGYGELVRRIQNAAQKVVEQRVEARRDLAAVYLKELSDAAFARAAQLTGFKGFERRDPRQAMAQERKSLERSIAQIDTDERYARRDLLVGPAGTLTQE